MSNQGLHAGELCPGDLFAARDFGAGPKTLTIKSVGLSVLKDPETNKSKERGTVHFTDDKRGWVLNQTNVSCLAHMFGEWSGKWIGKRVTLYMDATVAFGGDTVSGIRVAGSPDIAEDMEIEIKHRKKRARVYKLKRTGGAVDRVKDALGATVKATKVEMTAEQKGVVTARREALAVLMRRPDETPESAAQRAKERLGTVGAASFDAWLVRADGVILDGSGLVAREPGGEG